MNDEQMERVLDGLESLGGQAAELGEQAFEVTVRQQVIEGWGLLAVGAILILGYLAGMIGTYRHCKAEKQRHSYRDYEAFGFAAVFGAIPGLFGLGMTAFGVLHLLNPVYYAVRDVVQMVGGG